MKTFKRYLVWIILSILLLVSFYLFHRVWGDPNKAQVVAALFTLMTTALLVGITAEYVLTNQHNLNLLRAQWKKQNEVEVFFGVRARNGRVSVWVANLGLPNVIVTKIVVRELRDSSYITVYRHMIVRSGQKRIIDLPEELSRGVILHKTIEVVLHFESSDQQLERVRAYTLFASSDNVIYKVQKGIHTIWTVTCPQCGDSLNLMLTDGLVSFAKAKKREAEMENELRATCPDHQSQWTFSMDTAAAYRLEHPENDAE